MRGKAKIVMESVQTNCDHNFVEYFHKVTGQELLHSFRVVKQVPSFTINVVMRALRSQRIMYKMDNLNGCQFLHNPLLNKVFSQAYHAMIVNGSFFKCPIEPRVYFLTNLGTPKAIPNIHPAGRFQLNVRIKISEIKAPFVMEVIWKYNVIKL